MGDSRHSQNIQINKVIGENEKCVFYFMEKTIRIFWPTQYFWLSFFLALSFDPRCFSRDFFFFLFSAVFLFSLWPPGSPAWPLAIIITPFCEVLSHFQFLRINVSVYGTQLYFDYSGSSLITHFQSIEQWILMAERWAGSHLIQHSPTCVPP